MHRPGLANQSHLLLWADSIAARGEFPRLVRRLILETGKGVVQLGFPAGEGTSVGGWDGTVRTTDATAFIPHGLSLWELSVESSVGTKAESDYRKRLSTPDGSPTASCIYVAASLRRFAKRMDWAHGHAKERRWNDVRAYGADDFETWLESAPVTHVWLSDLLNLHPTGLVAAESWWHYWSTATEPGLTPAVIRAGREEAVNALNSSLVRSTVTTIKGGSLAEVMAFVWATVQSEVTGDGGSLAARTAWVDDVATWRALVAHPERLVLIPTADALHDEMVSATNHRIVIPVFGSAGADVEIPPLDSLAVTELLQHVGLDRGIAEEAGRISRMSLSAMRRHIAVKPELHQPEWARSPVTRNVRRTVLVSRWKEDNDADRAVLSDTLGLSHDDSLSMSVVSSPVAIPCLAGMVRKSRWFPPLTHGSRCD